MRRYRRMVLIDRLIPFLAAMVGLVALAGAVLVQLNTTRRDEAILAELAAARQAQQVAIERHNALVRQIAELGAPVDDGTAEALLALQDRMVKLEEAARTAPLAAPAPLGTDGQPASSAVRPIDPNLPTKDCIPLDTRFMVTPGDSFPICQSRVVIKAATITGDMVVLDDGTAIPETVSAAIPGSTCTALVFSADLEGFAEMRVNCQ